MDIYKTLSSVGAKIASGKETKLSSSLERS